MAGRVRERGTEEDRVAEAVAIPAAPAAPSQVAELLTLQRSAGNAAVARMLARQESALAEEIPPPPAYEDDVPPPPPLFGEDEEAIPPAPLLEDDDEIPGPPELEEDDDLPPPPGLEEDDDVPPPPPEQEHQELAEEAQLLAGRPALAAAVLANAPEVIGLGPAEAAAAPVAQAGRWQRFKRGAGSVASAVGGAARAVGSTAVGGLRALGRAIGAVPGGIVDGVKYIVRKIQSIDRNTVRDGAVTVAKLGLQPIVGAAVPAVKMAMEGTRQIVTSVPFVQLPVSLIGSVFDGRSLIKSINHARGLGQIERDARAAATAPDAEGTRELLPSLRAAKRLKWRKAAAKGLATAGGVLGIAAAAALLASNPVGWALVIAGTAVAAGAVILRLAHNHRHRFGLKSGQERRERIADALLAATRGGRGERELAERAIAELGVDVWQVSDEEARKRIIGKLKV